MDNKRIAEHWIENELKRDKDIHYRLSRRLGKISTSKVDERLSCSIKKGHKYYSEVWMENGERKSRYLGGEDNKDVLEIQEKRFIRKVLPILEKRIEMLRKSPAYIMPLDFNEINESLPNVYRLPSERVRQIIGPDEAGKWYLSSLDDKKKLDKRYGIRHPEDLIHIAKDGTPMRSKSEVIIANELINYGIPYIYEMPINVKNFIMHPDFMFYSHSRGKPMIWEHVGMIGDEGYKQGFEDRMDTYMRGGIATCVDIIITFDTTDGRLDTELIDRIIEDFR